MVIEGARAMTKSVNVCYLIVLCAFITACAPKKGGNWVGANVESDAGQLPGNFKRLAEIDLKARLKDPDSAKIVVGNADKTSCSIGIYGQFHGWRVPIRYNAKNSFGGYVGERTIYYWFNGPRVRRISDSPTSCP